MNLIILVCAGLAFVGSISAVRSQLYDNYNLRRLMLNKRTFHSSVLNQKRRDDISAPQLMDFLKRSESWMKNMITETADEIPENPETSKSTTGINYTRPIESATCGRQKFSPDLSGRIYGGIHAVPHSWPWQILYQEEITCGDNQKCFGVCGGTLLNANYVLTAAHCIHNKDNCEAVTMVAGLHNKEADDEVTNRQILKASEIFVHPGWDPEKIENDLAIIRLTEPVEFNDYVQPVCLPGPDPEPGSTVYLIGWGAESMHGTPYHILKQAPVHVIGNCEEYWPQIDDAKQICLGHRGTGFSACKGDSGGSALQEHGGQWVIEGVASFVSDCKTEENMPPNVYVRVSAYLPWINSIIDH